MMKPPRKGMSPNSLANLIPPKKGEVRNPKGITDNLEVRRVKKLTAVEVAEVATMILEKNVRGLQDMIDDARGPDKTGNPNSEHSSLKVWMAMVAIKGITKGDPYMLDALLNRIMGKVHHQVHFTGAVPPPIPVADKLSSLTYDERQERIESYKRMLMEAVAPEPIDVTAQTSVEPQVVSTPKE